MLGDQAPMTQWPNLTLFVILFFDISIVPINVLLKIDFTQTLKVLNKKVISASNLETITHH